MIEYNGAYKSSPPKMRKSVSALTRNVIELAELQFELFKLDSAKATRKVKATIVFFAIGLALLLASLPVAMMAAGEALVQFQDWSRAAAWAVSAASGLGLCLILLFLAWWKLNQALASWRRSNKELSQNVNWLKCTFRGEDPTVQDLKESRLPKQAARHI